MLRCSGGARPVQRCVPGYGGEPRRPAAAALVKAVYAVPHAHGALREALLPVGVVRQYGRDDIAQQRPEMGEQRLYPALVADFYEFDYLLRLHQLTPSVSASSISLNT